MFIFERLTAIIAVKKSGVKIDNSNLGVTTNLRLTSALLSTRDRNLFVVYYFKLLDS